MFGGCKSLRFGVVNLYVRELKIFSFKGCNSFRSGFYIPTFGGCKSLSSVVVSPYVRGF